MVDHNDVIRYMNERGVPIEEYQAQLMKIEKLYIKDLVPFRGQRPFKAYNEDTMDLLVEDIKANGVLHPIVVRRVANNSLHYQYEILSGHNRAEAAKRAGFNMIMCNVINLKIWGRGENGLQQLCRKSGFGATVYIQPLIICCFMQRYCLSRVGKRNGKR